MPTAQTNTMNVTLDGDDIYENALFRKFAVAKPAWDIISYWLKHTVFQNKKVRQRLLTDTFFKLVHFKTSSCHLSLNHGSRESID